MDEHYGDYAPAVHGVGAGREAHVRHAGSAHGGCEGGVEVGDDD